MFRNTILAVCATLFLLSGILAATVSNSGESNLISQTPTPKTKSSPKMMPGPTASPSVSPEVLPSVSPDVSPSVAPSVSPTEPPDVTATPAPDDPTVPTNSPTPAPTLMP